MELRGKTVFITGACGGIGRSLTEKFLKKGAIVIATDFREDGLQELRAEFDSEYEEELTTLSLDVTSQESWNQCIEFIDEHYPRGIDVLINNAGVLKPGYIPTITKEDIDFHIDVNVKGVMLGTVLCFPFLQRTKGHIINLASLAGVAPVPGISLYSASKFAVRGFSLAAAAELKQYGIKVTVICPDAVQTPMLDLQKDYEEAALTFSGGKPLTPDEVANAILQVVGQDKLEVLLPPSRGILAKATSAIPEVADLLLEPLKQLGLAAQKKYRP
ncbi:MAG: SDR family NAD(P)-dependent oxidoreductase [Candidatus Hydrogenedentota bacterium]|nr:MAG: SDR family NAD(P)-dependent oxidoreductase [Candidatus Hydrogenedentota bacterium]